MATFMLFLGEKINWVYVGAFIAISILVRYLLIQQYNVNDKDYARAMIEHHEVAIVMSEKLVAKNIGGPMTDLANNIIKTQTAEVQQMKTFLG